MKNEARELIMRLEVNEYLKVQTQRIGEEIRDTFPEIKDINVVISILFNTLDKEDR